MQVVILILNATLHTNFIFQMAKYIRTPIQFYFHQKQDNFKL